MEKSEVMKYWDKLKTVPKDRQKAITGGRLKGKTDINPQWRYEVLTQTFGPCGIGWKFTIDKKWTEPDPNGHEVAAFADVSLFVKFDGESWSDAIPGNGGSMFVSQEKNGMYLSDECFKMAITDALSTACKMIGVGADIYLGLNDTKYPTTTYQQKSQTPDKPWLNPGDKNWPNVVKAMKDGFGLPDIMKKYAISKVNQEKLQNEANK